MIYEKNLTKIQSLKTGGSAVALYQKVLKFRFKQDKVYNGPRGILVNEK